MCKNRAEERVADMRCDRRIFAVFHDFQVKENLVWMCVGYLRTSTIHHSYIFNHCFHWWVSPLPCLYQNILGFICLSGKLSQCRFGILLMQERCPLHWEIIHIFDPPIVSEYRSKKSKNRGIWWHYERTIIAHKILFYKQKAVWSYFFFCWKSRFQNSVFLWFVTMNSSLLPDTNS